MKTQFIKITPSPGEPLTATEVIEQQFSAPLHYHPEIELVLILESSGRRFVGDSIESFGPGDLVLIGENIPHFWCNDKHSDKHNDKLVSDKHVSIDTYSRAIVVQFNKSFLGENFFNSTGANHIVKLLNDSLRGVCLTDHATKALVTEKLMTILDLGPFEKTLLLLEILNIFAKSKDVHYLSSPGFKPYLNEVDCTKMNKVYNYIYNNIGSSFDQSEVASLVNMSVSAFCHYFKKRTQKTFSQFITEIRIGNAKRLLIETDMSIAEIAYESGYNSLSNFNKQFYAIENVSPKIFRKNYSAGT